MKSIGIVEHVNDFLGERNKEAVFRNAPNAISIEIFSFVMFIVLMEDCVIRFENEGKGFAQSYGDWDRSDEPYVSACLNRHFYLLQNHQQ